jgi:FtsP/CotA-like multicopper oxidase with cupredoxin domain
LIIHAVERGPLFDPDRRVNPNSPVTLAGQGDQDDNDPARPIATILVSPDSPTPRSVLPKSPIQLENSAANSLASTRPVRTRKFYFSEELVEPRNPRGPTRFYITEEGHVPKTFDPSDGPNVTVEVGDVEDWIIENRSTEPHTFHIHQTHFLVVGRTGGSYEELTLRDTINIPYWNGFTRQYPSVRLRLDFRDPKIIGTFPYHCHILQHEDGGMMGSIRVLPRRNEK